jgi:bacterioferritin-associated ferredoxin
MIVCQCNRVTDRQIRRAVRDGAQTLRAVAQRSGAGLCCGGCHDDVRAVIEDERSRAETNRIELPVLAPAAG